MEIWLVVIICLAAVVLVMCLPLGKPRTKVMRLPNKNRKIGSAQSYVWVPELEDGGTVVNLALTDHEYQTAKLRAADNLDDLKGEGPP